MSALRACLSAVVPSIAAALAAAGSDLKNGPWDGTPFRPNVPVTWAANSAIPQNLTIYQIAAEKLSQPVLSNAMAMGSFKSINLVKSKNKDLIEFRDRPRIEDLTRSLKLSATRGWVRYNDNRAGGSPVHGVPTPEDAEKQALRYLTLLGGDIDQLSPKPWPHSETTFETFDKPGGQITGRGVSRRWVCLFRQLEGIPVTGNSLSVDFGNDAKPITLELNWPPVKPVLRVRAATRDEILHYINTGKSRIPTFPPPPAGIAPAQSYALRNVVLLYPDPDGDDGRAVAPYGSMLIQAEANSNQVNFVVNCPITAE